MLNSFIRILNMSISASGIVLIVFLLRIFLKKTPKWMICVLWAMVALRLVLPVLPESAFSLMPQNEVISQKTVSMQDGANQTTIPAVESLAVESEMKLPKIQLSLDVLQILIPIWLVGIAGMLGYSLVAYLVLRKRVAVTVAMEKNVFLCDQVDSPFVFGIFIPKIYIPSGIEKDKLPYILAHEKAHIRRKDHWWKPVGFVLLSIHWFNPVLWIAYIFLCRDIEQACDEKVVAGMSAEDKIGYLQALVTCSARRRLIMVCPVAFGEIGVKTRIKGVLSYKKPAFWIILASVVACIVVAVCFLTNPETCMHVYKGELVTAATCTQEGVEKQVCIFCQHSYTVPVAVCEHTYDAGTIVKPASCIEKGVLERHCTGCTAVQTESVEESAHLPGEFTLTKEPTCAEEGEKSSFCTVCQALCGTESVAKTQEHILQETVLRESTCTEAGEGLRTCTRCAYSETVAYDRIGHDFRTLRTDPSTCQYYGEIIQTCFHCDTVNIVKQTELGDHSWVPTLNGLEHCFHCGTRRYDDMP